MLEPVDVEEAERQLRLILGSLETEPYDVIADRARRVSSAALIGLGGAKPKTRIALHRLTGKALLVEADAIREVNKITAASRLAGEARRHAALGDDKPLAAAAAHVETALAFYGWGGPRRAVDRALEALGYTPNGQMSIRLHLEMARALALMGRKAEASKTVTHAWDQYERLSDEETSADFGQWFDGIHDAELIYHSAVALMIAGDVGLATIAAVDARRSLAPIPGARGYEGMVGMWEAIMCLSLDKPRIDQAVALASEALDLWGDCKEKSTNSIAARFVRATPDHRASSEGLREVVDRVGDWQKLPLR